MLRKGDALQWVRHRGWALVGGALVGPLGPREPGPCGTPLGRCVQGPCGPPWALIDGALVGPLRPYGLGPHGPPVLILARR